MSKKHDDRPSFPTSVKLDPMLRQAARDAGLNLRELLERAIKEKLQTVECPMCGHRKPKVKEAETQKSDHVKDAEKYMEASIKKVASEMSPGAVNVLAEACLQAAKRGIKPPKDGAKAAKLIERAAEHAEQTMDIETVISVLEDGDPIPF